MQIRPRYCRLLGFPWRLGSFLSRAPGFSTCATSTRAPILGQSPLWLSRALAVAILLVSLCGLTGCSATGYTHTCADWIRQQSELRWLYPGARVESSMYFEADRGVDSDTNPIGIVISFVPGGAGPHIVSWYADRLTRRGWQRNDDSTNWGRASGASRVNDLSIGLTVTSEPPASVSPLPNASGEWIDLSYSILPSKGSLSHGDAQYVCH
jgi:hypothetical protein